jgi:hypothetical protein
MHINNMNASMQVVSAPVVALPIAALGLSPLFLLTVNVHAAMFICLHALLKA